MINPESELKKYLEVISTRVVNIHAIRHQLRLLKEMSENHFRIGLQPSLHFFQLTYYIFTKELYMQMLQLVDDREDRSLIDYLQKLYNNKDKIELYELDYPIDPKGFRYLRVNEPELSKIILGWQDILIAHSEIIKRIKAHRDKVFAHADKKYFENPGEIFTDYKVSEDDYDTLLNDLTELVRNIYSKINKVDRDHFLHSSRNVDNIIVNSFAFERMNRDETLHEKNVFAWRYK